MTDLKNVCFNLQAICSDKYTNNIFNTHNGIILVIRETLEAKHVIYCYAIKGTKTGCHGDFTLSFFSLYGLFYRLLHESEHFIYSVLSTSSKKMVRYFLAHLTVMSQ